MRTNGFLTAEYSLYLTVISITLITLAYPLQRYFSVYQHYSSISTSIETITFHAQHHYAKSVLSSRCLSQTQLEIDDLDLSLSDDGVEYQVQYLQSGSVNTKPSGIQVSVTTKDSALMESFKWLKPDEVQGTSLLFNSPIHYEISDWLDLDPTTGCIK